MEPVGLLINKTKLVSSWETKETWRIVAAWRCPSSPHHHHWNRPFPSPPPSWRASVTGAVLSGFRLPCCGCDEMLQLWSLQPLHITSNRSHVGKRAAAKSSWLTLCERTHDSVKVPRPKAAFMNIGLKGLERAAFKSSFCLLTSFLSQHNNSEAVKGGKQQQELGLWFWLWLVLAELLSGSEREKGPELFVIGAVGSTRSAQSGRTSGEPEWTEPTGDQTPLVCQSFTRTPFCCKNTAQN